MLAYIPYMDPMGWIGWRENQKNGFSMIFPCFLWGFPATCSLKPIHIDMVNQLGGLG
jgi:hypothetical protein